MSVYLSIFKQWIIDPIQNSIVLPIFNQFTTHSIQTLLLLPIILPIFTINPIKTLLLLPIFLPILNLWIIHPLQNYIILPILKHFTTDRIQNHIILPILDLLPKDPIKKFLLLPIIGFFGKQIKVHLLKFVFVPIKPHICYPFKCDSYVEKLRKQTEELKEKRDSLEQSVFEADEVTKWLSCANNEINGAEALIQRKEEAKMKKCLFGLCPNLKSRYQLSREADKKASAIDKLRNQQGLVPFSSLPPLHQIAEPSVYSREALSSRVLILNQVMDALKDPNLYMIGVYGLGGVGKTTLAKEVLGKAVEEKMFKRVVMVPVSQTPDLRKIQEEIADFVDLKFDAQGEARRAIQLKERLEKSKVLIILDDIWTKLELNDVGIPLGDECKGSKLLLTSRSHSVLSREMGTQKEFSLEVLGEEETWSLFQMTVEDANNPELQAIAIKIAKKCSGLPLLVNIVASDLKNKELSAWRDALVKLSDLDNEEIHGKVHKVLKSSFENLPSNEAKSLFLLCSLFGQSNIPIDHLLTYAMGLDVFKNIVGVKVARDRLCVTIEKLKTESWLLDGDMNGHVKMHDVVLDFARSIAAKDEHAFFGNTDNGLRQLWPENENCTRIVLHHCNISELPEGLEYPNAELLSLFTKDLNLVIPDLFFKGISKLKVLNLTGMCLVPLTSSLQFLTSLHSLYMHQCRLKDVAIIGDLKQLEFLSFEKSHIVELPRQLGELTQLKSLNLTKCSYLKVIPPNVLPKLSLLEDLYIESFDKWDLNGNASLMELEELRQLTTLEVKVSRSKELPNQLFSKELERYKISIGNWSEDWWTYKGLRTLKLRLETSIHLEDGLKKLLRGSEDLLLGEVKGMENGLYVLNEEGFPKLKHLRIDANDAIRHIMDPTVCVSCDAFPILETLHFHELNSLEEICHGRLGTGSFRKLRTLRIIGCGKLKKLFAFSTAKNLSQLQEMEVSNCNNLEAIIAEGSEDGICNPRKVSSEIQTEMAIFPNLQTMNVSDMDNLEYIWHGQFTDDDSLCKLKSLRIDNCSKLKALFATSKNVMRRFQRLEKLDLWRCQKMEVIYQMEKLGSIDEVAFELRQLRIWVMPSLKRIWSEDANGIFNFPNLKSVQISWCDVLEYVFPESIASGLLQLEELEGGCCQMEHVVGNAKNGEPYNCRWPKLKHFKQIDNSQKANQVLPWLAKVSCPNLTSMEVLDCNSLKYMFKTSTVKSLLQLKSLKIKSCELMEEIILTKEFEAEEMINKIVFSKLDLLELKRLPNLIRFSNDYFIEFQSLREMKISKCPTLKNFVTHISNNNSSNDVRSLFNEMAIFPNLQTMDVSFMDNLEYIRHGEFADDDSLCKLKSLRINRCSKLKAVFATSKNVMRRFQKLEELELLDCPKMEVIYQMEELGSIDEVAFELIHLKIQYMPSLKWIWSEDANGVFTFPNLNSVEVSSCGVLEYVFPASIAFELTHLKIHYMWSLKRIWSEDANGISTFPNLNSVQVSRCRVLEYVFPESIASGLSQLEKLKVQLCNMAYVVGNTKSGESYTCEWPNLKHFQLIDNSQKANEVLPWLAKVSPNLKRMELEGINTICEYGRLKILMPSPVCFKNLTYLEASKCDEMINLITVSTAKSLVLLRTMIIRQCKMIEEIVGFEYDGSEDVIDFNQLRCLKLHGLPSLTCFCSSNCAFDFPNLNDVKIIECPNMKTFSQQVLTPKLREVKTSSDDDWDWKWEGSLNNTIQKLFMDGRDEKATDEESEMEKIGEEKEDDDDDAEAKETDDDDDDEADP